MMQDNFSYQSCPNHHQSSDEPPQQTLLSNLDHRVTVLVSQRWISHVRDEFSKIDILGVPYLSLLSKRHLRDLFLTDND